MATKRTGVLDCPQATDCRGRRPRRPENEDAATLGIIHHSFFIFHSSQVPPFEVDFAVKYKCGEGGGFNASEGEKYGKTNVHNRSNGRQ